jgi:Lon protease-like protein
MSNTFKTYAWFLEVFMSNQIAEFAPIHYQKKPELFAALSLPDDAAQLHASIQHGFHPQPYKP